MDYLAVGFCKRSKKLAEFQANSSGKKNEVVNACKTLKYAPTVHSSKGKDRGVVVGGGQSRHL